MQFQASQVFHTRDGAVCACRMLRRWMWISRALRKVIVGARVPVQGRSLQTSGCEPCVVCVPSVSPCQRNTPHIHHHVSASFVHTHIALERHKIWSCRGRSAPVGIMARPLSASVTTEESPKIRSKKRRTYSTCCCRWSTSSTLHGLWHACRLDGTRPVGAGARTVEDAKQRLGRIDTQWFVQLKVFQA